MRQARARACLYFSFPVLMHIHRHRKRAQSAQSAQTCQRPNQTYVNMDIHALEQEVLALEYETCEDWVRIQELESLEITRLHTCFGVT
jgi:hypothetical protein